MLDGYHRALGDLRRALQDLRDLAERAGEPEVVADAEGAASALAPRRFRVAFVGEFKAGKSTLINALLGRELLPVATRECSTVIARLRSDPDLSAPSIRARRASGQRVDVDADELDGVLTARDGGDDPILEVEILLPGGGWPGAEVELVDTPGTGAAGLARELATLAWLPNADAVVFVTRADQLLSDSELAFLQRHVLIADPAAVFVVVNRSDEIATSRDRTDLELRAIARLRPILGDTTRIAWTSAADGLDAALAIREVWGGSEPEPQDRAEWERSGVPELRDKLSHFLTQERLPAELERQARAARRLQAELDRRLSGRLEAGRLDTEALELRRNRQDQLLSALTAERVEIGRSVDEHFRRAEQTLLHQVTGLADALHHDLQGLTDPKRAASTLRAHRERALASLQASLVQEYKAAIEGVLRRLARIGGHLGDGSDGLPRHVAELRAAVGGEVQTRTQVTHERVDGPGAANQAAVAFGASVGGLIGYVVLGPLGGLIGAAIGASSMVDGSTTGTRTRQEVVVDPAATTHSLRSFLSSAVRTACRQTAELTRDGAERVLDAQIRETRQRRDREVPRSPTDLQALALQLDELRSLAVSTGR